MIELKKVENLNGDLSSIKTRIRECDKAAQEITTAVRNRIIDDQKNAERRADELKKEIDSGVYSDVVCRIKQKEVEAIACRQYEPTESERVEFNQAIEEYETTLADLINKQNELKEAITEARQCLGETRENIYNGADPDLIKKWIASQIQEFAKLSALKEDLQC